MSVIHVSEADGEQQIDSWVDGSTAVITWRVHTGGTHQREFTDEREALRFLATVDDDPELTVISADLRRPGNSAGSRTVTG